ncbi:MAG: hypothetical protein KAQ69_03215 [Spirochaetales bacterium]|nr:hypothetical protein [Spirochaetales bacterium]
MKMKKTIFVILVLLIAAGSGMLFARGGSDIPEDALVAKQVKSAPELDGRLDDAWQLAKSLEIPVEVADYAHFAELYRGKEYEVTLRAMYTDTDLYMFVQWTGDESLSDDRQSWYYNDDAGKWMQKPKKEPDEYTPPGYEDKFAFLWEIESKDFLAEGGSIFCHEAFKHATYPDELMDIWHWKLVRTAPVHQLDDKYLVYADESDEDASLNGRKSDEGSGAYSDNKQTLTVDGVEMTLPLLWIPGETGYSYILDGNSAARQIVGMDENMNLIDEDGTILTKEDFMLGSDKLIPSIKGVKPATDSRGDVTVYEYYDTAAKTWNLEIKRKLATGNADDVQFDDLEKMYNFSISVFDNAAIAHATPEGITGKAYTLVFQ